MAESAPGYLPTHDVLYTQKVRPTQTCARARAAQKMGGCIGGGVHASMQYMPVHPNILASDF